MKTYLLDGKEVSITIKEKEAIVVDADADVTVLEAKENGAEITTLKATVENGIAKVKIKLRPKADEDLKTWKEKLLKGKKEEAYSYTFKNDTTITDNNKKQFATIILNNAKDGKQGNTKIATGKTAFADDVEKALQSKTYNTGATINFDTYKTQAENLWLKAECQGDTKKHEGEYLKKDGEYFVIGKNCECEARVRAFMRTIRVAEGTGEYFKGTKVARDPQLGYTTWFSGSGNNFTLSDDHPRTINHNSTETVYSSAAGAYQTMSWKFDELNGYDIEAHNYTFRTVIPKVYKEINDKAKKHNAKGFLQESQDKLCVIILKDKGVITKLLIKDIEGAITKSSGTWVSLPGATAGQPTAKMKETLDYYDEFLKEELAGKSNLHIKKGFLKDFDITCNCVNKESSSTWHHPVNNPQLRGWYSVWAPERSIHGDNIVGRTAGKHDGLDLYAPTGTDLYACVDGEVNEVYYSETYGNCVNIKGEYNGKTYWFFYAHLSETLITAKDKDGNSTKVKAGDKIGKSGKSGSSATALNANQVHLHFEVRTSSARTGGRVNPFDNITELNTEVIKEPKKESQP